MLRPGHLLEVGDDLRHHAGSCVEDEMSRLLGNAS